MNKVVGNSWRYNKGFTIVELLIVVVVIAILAAITIVAYNGITRKAHAVAYASAADAIETQIQLLNVQGDLTPGMAGWFCWGDKSDYPQTSDFDEGVCQASLSNNANPITVNENIMNTLRSKMAGLALPSGLVTVKRTDQNVKSRGIVVVINTNPSSSVAIMFWYTPDPSGCGRAGFNSATAPGAVEIRAMYEQILPILYSARNGTLTYAQATTQVEAIIGGPLDEPLSASNIAEIIGPVEVYLRDFDSAVMCQHVIDL